MPTPIRQLLDLLVKTVDTLENACAESGTEIPDLYAPFTPPSEAFRANPVAAEAASIISAAALHINALVTPPQVSLYHSVGGHFRSAALRICLESNVTEILREAGPKGLSVQKIASINGQDPRKLSRFLRILATHHVYREVEPDVFANTRISSMLDTLKPSKDIFAAPEHKHDNTPGLAAFSSHHLDEAFKASAYAWEALSDPSTRHSGDITAAPFALAFNTKDTMWQFYERPEESYRLHRFGVGMQGVEALQPADAILSAYDWKSLAPKSLIVDVGGGVGTSSLPIASHFPNLRLVVQDLSGPISDAKKLWASKLPDAVNSGRVLLEAHSFFEPQPPRDVSVFLLKQITHDWSDQFCVKFLAHLRKAASAKTKLILVDSILPLACREPVDDDSAEIPGAIPSEAPAPLLANYGAVNDMGYNADIDMFLLFNSQERTFRHLKQLLLGTGWKVTLVRRHEGDSTFLQSIEAVPV